MKDLFKILLVAVGISVFLTACDTDAEIKDPANLTDPDRSEQYYEQLRAYKQTDHPVAFGWFGNWVGAGASLENSLRGLPDSVDFVSIWGNWHSLNDVRKADLAYVQQKKGTRALICFIVANVGDQLTPEGIDPIEYWGEGEQGIRRYANAICDTIDKYGYDGFDYDYEPHYGSPGNISGRPEAEKVFIEELGKRIGRKSGTQKLLVIDGEPQSINPEVGDYFNYFIVQAYACSGDANLDARLSGTIRNFDGVLTPREVAKRYIVTENFENYAPWWRALHRPQRQRNDEPGGHVPLDASDRRYALAQGWCRHLPHGVRVQCRQAAVLPCPAQGHPDHESGCQVVSFL